MIGIFSKTKCVVRSKNEKQFVTGTTKICIELFIEALKAANFSKVRYLAYGQKLDSEIALHRYQRFNLDSTESNEYDISCNFYSETGAVIVYHVKKPITSQPIVTTLHTLNTSSVEEEEMDQNMNIISPQPGSDSHYTITNTCESNYNATFYPLFQG
jgi:hypothetical protein